MRLGILWLVTAILCIAGLVRPRWGLYGYMWFSIMKPDDWAYAAGFHPTLIAVATIIGSLRYSFSVTRLFRNPITVGLLLLLIPITASVVLAVDPELAYEPYRDFMKMLLMMLVVPVVLQTVTDLRDLLIVIGLSLGILGARFGASGLLHGGARFSDGYARGLLSDNNCLALALMMGVPLCWYARSMVQQWWLRQVLLACSVLSICAVIMTYSRGGALCAALVVFLISIRSKYRVAVLLLFCVLMGSMVFLLGDGYLDRMATLKDPTQENSANDRLLASKAAIAMWRDYPLTGVGFGGLNHLALQHKYFEREQPMVVHNTYVELLVGSGIVAFVIYLAVIGTAAIALNRFIRREAAQDPMMASIGMALQVSLLTFCLGAFFLSRVTFDIFYMILAAIAVYWNLVAQRRTDSSEEFQEDEGLAPVTA